MIQNAFLASRISKRMDSHLSYHGISFTEFLILHQINKSVAKTMRRIDLAESVCLSASGVTRLLAPMQKIGLVEKESNPRDARQSLVKLSRVGARLYQEALVSFQHCADGILDSLSGNQVDKLVELSHKLN